MVCRLDPRECACGICDGGQVAPEGYFGGSWCPCECHALKGEERDKFIDRRRTEQQAAADKLVENAFKNETHDKQETPRADAIALMFSQGDFDKGWAAVRELECELGWERTAKWKLASSVPSATLPRDAASAWNAALDAAAKEVASHWNHSDTEVNQQAQAQRSAAAILRLKRK